MLTRARHDHGFTLIELLVGMSMGMIVLFALLTLLDQGAPAARRVTDRADADARARGALEQIAQELHSVVCVANGTDANGQPVYRTPIASADGQQITFYAAPVTPAAAAANTFTPEQRQLLYSGGTIVERRWAASGTPATFPNVTSTRTVLTDVRPTVAGGPIFSISAYDPNTGTLAATTDATKAASVDVRFSVDPAGAPAGTPQAVSFDSSIALALPTDFTTNATASNGPRCTL
jgi:type II secretory pathway pseudopilin PulG